MRPASLGLTARVVAVAMLLAAGASVAAGRADASAVRLAAAGPAPSSGGTWGTAIEVPGTAALNKGGNADLNSVSCATAGNCGAGGSYTNASGTLQAFVVSETGGTWGSAIEVPGAAALNAGGNAWITSLSCSSAGNCSAGGDYFDATGRQQVFLVNETGGTWGTAFEVRGMAALNQGGYASINSVSCPSAGNCAAGGSYQDASGASQAFVVNKTGCHWGTAIEVPGTAALNKGFFASVASVSCSSVGDCAAGGSYQDAGLEYQAFVVNETAGQWGTAIEVPGTAALNKTGGEVPGYAGTNAVSCVTASYCGAVGDYTYAPSANTEEAFVATERQGIWRTAVEVPGTPIPMHRRTEIASVSCTAPGDCSAGGYYAGGGVKSAFVVTETGGHWGRAIEVPGLASLNAGGQAEIGSVSCATAGNCSAGGYYASSPAASGYQQQAFVVDQTGGTWGTAIEVPGTAALNARGFASVNSVSCPAAGDCSAGGGYYDASGDPQVFVVSQTSSTGQASHS
jgi:hypothetical protein